MKFLWWVYYDPHNDELILAPSPEEMGCVRISPAGVYELEYVGEL